MFPTPIEQTRPLTRTAYRVGIPLLLLVWLLPILAVAMMSVCTPADMNSGMTNLRQKTERKVR